MLYDVVIIGGGPAGLSAALALGRARKRVLLLDAGPRRNAAAAHIYNVVTRDGTPPDEFRGVARQQLARYPNVEVRDLPVTSVTGARGDFRVALPDDAVTARRVLLCTGMIDELPPLEGMRELWGRSIFQCPYCHGWESQDLRWGYLVGASSQSHWLTFAIQARGWTRDVVVFTAGSVVVDSAARATLAAAGTHPETQAVTRLVAREGHLEAVALADGTRVACDVLFTHPPQRQVAVVAALGLALDGEGYVQADPMTRETSVPGIHAAGDLTTRMQGAIFAAAMGTQAAAMLNTELTLELVTRPA